jgi:hypothetical protein
MIGLLCFALAVLASPFKSKLRLQAENAVLRHQLIVLRRRLPGRVPAHEPWPLCVSRSRTVPLARFPNVLALDISRLAGRPISNGTVIAAAVALGFLASDMSRRSRLLAECVDQREPSRYSAAGLGQWWSPVDSRRRRGRIHHIKLRERMYPGSFGKARMISPGFYFLGIKTIPAVYGEDRDH